MTQAELRRTSVEGAGERMHALATDLFPICRSITGDGLRETLRRIGERIPLELHEVPTGTQVLDWTIPDEWNIRGAHVDGPDGKRIVDFRDSNLHVVGYSEPIRKTLTVDQLRPHLHTHEVSATWIPYRTSYYARTWGFCLSRETRDELEEGLYEVVIDSTLEPGSLTYGECFLPGEATDEVVFTAHVCHPSLANDNLSGVVALAELAAVVRRADRRLSYRFLFIPGTIGSIAWLARNHEAVERVVGGLVLACVGDAARLTYKRSRRSDAPIDRAAAHVVSRRGGRVLDFVPWGWDERQFNSPGFDLGVGCLTRSLEGEFPEYHSSADDLALIRREHLEESLAAAVEIVDILENDRKFVNLSPNGEPQLGKRNLYRGHGGPVPTSEQLALLWVLNQSDGSKSLLDIANRADLPFSAIASAARDLAAADLLEERP